MNYLTAKIRETIKKAIEGDAAAQVEAQQIQESEFSFSDKHKALYAALRNESNAEDGYVWRYIRDIYDTWLVYERYTDGNEVLYRADYVISDAGEATITNPQRVKVAYEVLPPLPLEINESARRRICETAIAPRAAGTKAIREDGTMLIRIIGPEKGADGKYPDVVTGSSGRYSRAVLERDIPRIFPIGSHMYANHLSAEEEINQPEGRIEFLAAVTTTTPVWLNEAAAGPGMYCECKPFQDWAPMLDDKATAIGTSINAWAIPEIGPDGIADFVQLTEGGSIDFVTRAGAGGAIPISEARRPVSTYPTNSAPNPTEDTVTPQEAQQLRESAARVPALETENSTLKTENARLKEAALINQARGIAESTLAAIEMPEMTRLRLIEAQAAKPAIKDGALDVEAFTTQVTEAATVELTYLQEATGYGTGKVRGNGTVTKEADATDSETEAKLTEAFKDLGLSEGAAKVAANGR